MRNFLFILVLLLVAETGTPQGKQDTTQVSVRNISAERIKQYQADPAFQYDPLSEPAPSYWDRFWLWVWSKISKLFGTPRGARIFRWIMIIFASGLLLFFIIRLSGMSGSGLFGKKNRGDLEPDFSTGEDIHAINFNKAIQQAVAAGNYRLAVRLLYLQSLKALADRDMIHWQLDKTNSAYVKEIRDDAQKTAFYQLTRRFENNWYGNMPVSENDFVLIRGQFEQFNQQLN
ncbi:MAG: DUF4129 domain-containing protein [Williamsia sp.]|nr:DUF4129 domain-containing protein [Williamsia sp.]